MAFKLLNGPILEEAPRYRGTYRQEPTYDNSRAASDTENQAFLEYINTDEEDLSEEDARRLQQVFQIYGKNYEVVRIDKISEEPAELLDGELGFDVAMAGRYSLLSWGLDWSSHSDSDRSATTSLILKLLEYCFRPRLNSNGLFDSWKDAAFFLDAMQEVSVWVPGIFESPDNMTLFSVVRIVQVPTPENRP
jgi:hypothetical protein